MSHFPWEKSYPPSLSWHEPLPPPFALEGLLEFAAHTWPLRTAIDFYDRTLTYRELWELAERTAASLQALGAGPGANVGLHLTNSPHFVIAFFGALLAGARVVNFNPFGGRDEFARQLQDSQCRVLLTADWQPLYPELDGIEAIADLSAVVVCRLTDFLAPAAAAALARPSARVPELPNALDVGPFLARGGPLNRHPRGPLEDEVAVLQYTGGTTGEAKGAMLTHANFAAVMHLLRRWGAAQAPPPAAVAQAPQPAAVAQAPQPAAATPALQPAAATGLPGPQRILAILPLFHIYGLNSILLPALGAGNEIVLHLRFEAGRVLDDITRKQINAFSGVPAMYTALVNHPRFPRANFASLLVCGSGGAPLPFELRKHFESSTERMLAEGYALTETTGLGTLPVAAAGVHRVGQVGLPVPRTLVEVVDLETGLRVLPLGETGEICFTGPQVMKGYWNRPEENAEVFRGGRFHTGDIGYIDENGVVNLTERKKDMLLVGGHNVYPCNIERAIYEHPDVMEVSVIGIPSADVGQVPKAFIALKPGSAPLTYRALCAFLGNKLASYELPLEMELRDSLPKTAIGKLSKRTLLEEDSLRRQKTAAAAAGGGAA